MAVSDHPADLVDVERDLGDQDHIGAAGDAGVKRDPACVPTHHLDHEDSVVALCGCVQTVDRLARDVQGGVEAERHIGRAEIVVDRLRHSDHMQTVCVQLGGDAERVLAANRDQAVERVGGERLADLVDSPLALVRVRSRTPEDRPAARQDPARGLDRERLIGVLEHSSPSVVEADQLVAVGGDALAHDAADHRVQPRTIPPTGEQPHSHCDES